VIPPTLPAAQLPLPNEASGEEGQDHVQEGPGPSTLVQDERGATGGQAAAPGGEKAPPGVRGSAQEQSGAGKAEEDGGGGQGHGSDGQQVGDKGEGGGGDGAAEDKVEAALFDMMSRSSRLMSMRWTEEKDKVGPPTLDTTARSRCCTLRIISSRFSP
jgi:hypothetical protein